MRVGDFIGRYELVAPLGEGAMGTVWEALLHGPHGFRRSVALKLLRADAHRPALIREARLGALLSHPNVVGVHDLGEAAGHTYVAMELVRGASVSDLLHEALPPRMVADIGAQAATGLAHAHALRVDGALVGLVHRDVKPGNLLADRTGMLKVADLGIARLTGQADAPAGTPGYLAPEQVTGQEDARADQFALGVTLYVLATRERPFGRGATALQRVRQAERWLEQERLLEKLDAVAPGLGPIVGRCLREDPERRFEDADALADALRWLAPRLPGGPTLAERVAQVRPAADGAEPISRSRRSAPTGTVRLARGNLPRPPDTFVGREDDRDALTAQLRAAPGLFTLMGPGGMGKTRLSIEAARAVAPELTGGAWFVDLSEARTAEGLCATVAAALDLPLADGDPVRQVGHALRALGPAVVVLDNLEQVADVAAAAVSRWLEDAAEARLVATSRVALRIRTEVRVSLGPLPVDEGVELFQLRAARPASIDELPVVRELVAGLDGMPLAIELAAARTRVLPVAGVLAHLGDRFRLLAGGGADRPERHRSLRASLDGSWELLSEWERDALAQLTVFADGFALSAADAVLDLGRWPDAPWALDVLGALVDASLLRFVPGEDRFRMFESVRAYAAERLVDERGARVRHRAWFAQHGSPAALAALSRHGGGERLRELVAERENLVTGVRRGVEDADHAHTAALALAAAEALSLTGPDTAAVELLVAAAPFAGKRRAEVLLAAQGRARNRSAAQAEALLNEATAAATGAPPRVAAWLELAWALHLLHVDRPRATAHLEAAAALVEQRAPELRGQLLSARGVFLMDQGSGEDAIGAVTEALAVFREVGDARAEMYEVGTLGNLWFDLGRLDEAAACFEQSLSLCRALGSTRAEVSRLGSLAKVDDMRGRYDDARRSYEFALAAHRRMGGRSGEAATLANLGLLEAKQGRSVEAFEHYRQSVGIHREVGNRRGEGIVLGNIGALCRATGDLPGALQHLEQALAVFEGIGAELPLAVFLDQVARVRQAVGRPEGAVEASDRSIGYLRRLGAVGHLANALLTRAELHADAEESAPASALLDEAVALARTQGPPGDGVLARAEALRWRL